MSHTNSVRTNQRYLFTTAYISMCYLFIDTFVHRKRVVCVCVCLFIPSRNRNVPFQANRYGLLLYWGCQTISAFFFNSKENEMYCVPLKAGINSFHQPLFNRFFNALTLFYWYSSFGAFFISGYSDSLFYCFNNFGYFEDYFTLLRVCTMLL